MGNGELNLLLIPHSQEHASKGQDRSVQGNALSGFS
jgi:hypothetical protein